MRCDGLVAVDKGGGWTSHDVVAKLRGVLATKKVGHSGTLDPDATGLLLVGVGAVTRLLRFLTVLPKRYTGEVVLGTETSTLDAAGAVTATHDMGDVSLEAVRAAASTLTGDIAQVPPMVSAVQIGGRRLHELARAGVEVEREPRPVTIHQFGVEPTEDPLVFAVDVSCSSGTYVRSLAADLGHALGGGAHLRNLRRTQIGSFTLDEAFPIDKVDVDALLDPASAMRDYEQVVVGPDVASAIAHGKVLPSDALTVHGDGPWAVVDDAGALLAVYQPHTSGTVKPAVVIPAAR
jgi:tRNA pseudouridine55 synthase